MGTFSLKVRSRHSCHHEVAGVKVPHMSVLRMGSQTRLFKKRIHINRPDRIHHAADKKKFHELLDAAGLTTAAPWQHFTSVADFNQRRDIKTPLVAKHRLGSRGTGVYLLKTKADIKKFIDDHGNHIGDYVFEKFMPYKREYRMHVWAGGCFYACRKALQNNCPKNLRWKMNNDSCTWFMDTNRTKFNKPTNWDEISTACVKALEALELDVVGFDVRVADDGRFFIVEANSAPSFAEVTTKRYSKILPDIVKHIKKTRGFEVY